MPRPRNKLYVCTACRVPFRAKSVVPCPNCGSTKVERALGKLDDSPEEVVPPTPPVATPPVATPPAIPKAPALPPMPAMKPPVPGGGAITPELLQGVKLKKVVRQARPLPGPPASPVPLGVRVLANTVRNPRLPPVRLGRPFPKTGPMYYLPTVPNKTLERELRLIASGAVNPAHGHFNTQYYNNSRELPTRDNPFDLVKAKYYEYGWLTPVPAAMQFDWRTLAGAPAPQHIRNTLGNYLVADGGQVNLERIIIAETGEIFYTPDHYRTFFRYSPVTMEWHQYLAPEKRYGWTEPEWDASIYYDQP
ncbi:hypothetical protein [Roseisolibacter agri]|uniref:Uncharacterized protein n=1 Tax=Roseisolibacter agri TaxID=2014610 RepID=A0AA37V6T4_9BACT|nr:hypothetical protein [Roseisolibacter agri]GLC25736.1 hypothetical protein rosag_22490 [Roseisolibacter agri]